MKKAKIGDKIRYKEVIEGIVDQVNENSVIVTITRNYSDREFHNNVTVVNHKNYIILD
ncbi:DUF2187 family protein [Mesobacillus harenae]|uniref:DUF2187 family protein n=1 Tax=Mesobacillus harenae TaxID=2213203 RepID=UPI001580F8C6|nr:DUF2187 family protein [Mesobacillus harenae]